MTNESETKGEATPEEKTKALTEFMEMTAKGALTMFNILGLKTHMDAMIIDDNTKDEYIFSFRKVGEGSNSWQKKTDELSAQLLKLTYENGQLKAEIESLGKKLK